MPIYFPSLVATFRLRFDETFQIDESPDPQSASSLAQKPTAPLSPLVRPEYFAGPAPNDRLSRFSNRVPKAASVELTGYRQAWKFNLTIAYKDLPIDPRVIRSCGVELYLGTVNPADFATGMTRIEQPSGRRLSILNTSGVDPFFVGIVDSWHVQHTPTSSEISMEGRDLRGLFLDSPVDPKLLSSIDLKQNIKKVVQQIIDKHPFGERVVVDATVDDWLLEISDKQALQGLSPDQQLDKILPSPFTKDGSTRLRRGADGKGARSSPQGGSSTLNFWDLITRYCFLCGAIPYFRGEKLRIRPARSMWDQQRAGFEALSSPFAGGKFRQVSIGDPPQTKTEYLSIRTIVHGRDVSNLSFERKYSGVKAAIVKVVGVDTSSSKRGTQALLEASWPDEKTIQQIKRSNSAQQAGVDQRTFAAIKRIQNAKKTGVSPSGSASSEETQIIPVHGVTDKATLQQIARAAFEEIGRGEMNGSFQTKNLSSFGTNDADPESANRDPDLLRLEPGDAVDIRVDTRAIANRAPLVSTMTNFFRDPFDKVVEQVQKSLGESAGIGSDDLARVLVAQARGGIIELQTVFRVNNVKYDWSIAGGIQIAADFHNYVEARSAVGATTGKNKSTSVRSSSGRAA